MAQHASSTLPGITVYQTHAGWFWRYDVKGDRPRGPFVDETAALGAAMTDDTYGDDCAHESHTTPDGHGAFCRFCGETLA